MRNFTFFLQQHMDVKQIKYNTIDSIHVYCTIEKHTPLKDTYRNTVCCITEVSASSSLRTNIYQCKTQCYCTVVLHLWATAKVWTGASSTVTLCCMYFIWYHSTTTLTLSLRAFGLCRGLAGLGPFGLWRLAHRIGGRRGTLWRNTNVKISDIGVTWWL